MGDGFSCVLWLDAVPNWAHFVAQYEAMHDSVLPDMKFRLGQKHSTFWHIVLHHHQYHIIRCGALGS